MGHHDLKIWPEHFFTVCLEYKRAEFRRDDRDPRFSTGDVLTLREWKPESKEETGRRAVVSVTHVARGGVIPEGYAMLSIELLSAPEFTGADFVQWLKGDDR